MIAAHSDTIVALSTPPGVGAIAVIRLSGENALELVNQVFDGKDLLQQKTHTVHFGNIKDDERLLDEVVVTLFKGPNSYTRENTVEISCHGSSFIVQSILHLMIASGARLARPGEFTQRAFLNGRFDLAQAEAVADLISSESAAAHRTALRQMRGGFSNEIKSLRTELVHFASMIELELDFSEEDVEFASRDELTDLVSKIQQVVTRLVKSFELGNVMKSGIPVVIAGKPNAGKSTLLNALLNEEKAIVSEIPGTTRDTIEDTINIEGIPFRFIDTAGLRETSDTIEAIGVKRTKERMEMASIIILLVDLSDCDQAQIRQQIDEVAAYDIPYLLVGNKSDLRSDTVLELQSPMVQISAKQQTNLDTIREQLLSLSKVSELNGEATVVTSSRHFESLKLTNSSLQKVLEGISMSISNDLLAMDIRQALDHLGEITGEITTEDLLDNIFSKFCIGK